MKIMRGFIQESPLILRLSEYFDAVDLADILEAGFTTVGALAVTPAREVAEKSGLGEDQEFRLMNFGFIKAIISRSELRLKFIPKLGGNIFLAENKAANGTIIQNRASKTKFIIAKVESTYSNIFSSISSKEF